MIFHFLCWYSLLPPLHCILLLKRWITPLTLIFSAHFSIFLYAICLDPNQARYQASPHPDMKFSLFITSIVLFIASEVPVIMGIINTYKTTGEMVYAFDNWSSLPVIVSSISFFYIIRYLFENISPKKKLSKFIQQVSATTFGIYLIHNLAINLLFEIPFVQNIFQINSYVVIILFQIFVFALCSVIIFLLKKIPGIRWFL